MKGSKITLFILLSLVLGIFTGKFFPEFAVKTDVLAHIFLNMIKMIIAPLLFSTLVVGIAGHGSVQRLGKIGLKSIIYFEIVTTLALIFGLVVANLLRPGIGFSTAVDDNSMRLLDSISGSALITNGSLSDLFLNIFPSSIFQAMAVGNLLQIVTFSIIFAIAVCAIGEKAKPFLNILESLSEIMFKFTEIVMYFAPFGIFGAIASTVGHNGLSILNNYAKVIFGLYVALFLFVAIVFTTICKIIKVPFFRFLKQIMEPLLLAFSTSSSEAALPKAMQNMENFGVSKNVVGFVIPLGYTFDLTGSTLYLAMGFIFSVQILGIELSLAQQITVMLILMFTSKGVAGVPRVSLVVLAGTLSSMGYSILGVAILLGIDQILDMGRTAINLMGNCLAALVIGAWEKSLDYDKVYDRQSQTADN